MTFWLRSAAKFRFFFFGTSAILPSAKHPKLSSQARHTPHR
jgi:hypothetical protein